MPGTTATLLCQHGQDLTACAMCRQHQQAHADLITNLDALLAAARPPLLRLAAATVCMFAMGVSNSFTNVIFLTIIQQIIPRHLLGRTMALIFLASFGTYPLSVAAAGFLVAYFGPVFLFPASGAALFLAIGYGLLRPELREL